MGLRRMVYGIHEMRVPFTVCSSLLIPGKVFSDIQVDTREYPQGKQ